MCTVIFFLYKTILNSGKREEEERSEGESQAGYVLGGSRLDRTSLILGDELLEAKVGGLCVCV